MEEKVIKKLLKLNEMAISKSEVPVSCAIIKNGKIISSAYNNRISLNDPTAHAEVLAIRKAGKKLKTWNLSDCKMYITLFPCKMCQEIIKESRISTVYYLLEREKIIDKSINLIKIDSCKNKIISNQIKSFFIDKR